MGRLPREKPRRLAAKLLQVRQMLDLTQEQMLAALKLDEKLFASAVSGYELGTREPPLLVLLKYARLAGVCMDVLVDDKLDLPVGGKGNASRRKGSRSSRRSQEKE